MCRLLAVCRVLLLFAVALSCAVTARAQLSLITLDEARTLLVGDGKKVWRVEEWRTINFASTCNEPPRYTFQEDGSVAIERCFGQNRITQTTEWQLEAREGDLIQIKIGTELYDLRFRRKNGMDQIKLRTIYETRSVTAEEIILFSRPGDGDG